MQMLALYLNVLPNAGLPTWVLCPRAPADSASDLMLNAAQF